MITKYNEPSIKKEYFIQKTNSPKNILFIYPLDESESLAIQYLSSRLKSAGHKTDLILYYRAEKNFKKRLTNKIKNFKPDFICFSTVTDDYSINCKLAKLAKELSDAYIVFGGIQVTSCPEEVISKEFIDYIVIGEGDEAIVELVENPNNSKIKNIWSKKGKKIIKNPIRPLIQNLDSMPFPDKQLFYREAPYFKDVYHCITSRGCPFSCTYCFNNYMRRLYKGNKWLRRRSVENVIRELKIMKEKVKYKQILFLDDCFTSDKDWLKEFAKQYTKEIRIPFKAISHPSLINEKIIYLLKKAGCIRLQIGVQTPCERMRKDICKRNESNEIIERAVKIIKKYKIMVQVDHIFGLPSEKIEDYKEGLEFYIKLKPTFFSSFWLQYYPNIEIVEIGKKYGDINDKILKETIKGNITNRDIENKIKLNKEILAISRFLYWIPILPRKFSRYLLKNNLYQKLFRRDTKIPYLMQHLHSLDLIKIIPMVIKRKILMRKSILKANKF